MPLHGLPKPHHKLSAAIMVEIAIAAESGALIGYQLPFVSHDYARQDYNRPLFEEYSS